MDGKDVDIRSFGFKGETLRALVDKEGEPWFVAKDVCGILGTRTDAIRAILDADEVSEVNPNTIGVARNGGHDWLIVSEAGLYGLILKSRKPEARAFKRWVTHEVLPSIRKHGMYATEPTIDRIISDPDFGIRLLTQLKHERERVRELEPKARAFDDFTGVDGALLIRDAAKVLTNAGTPVGERELRAWMAGNKWIYGRRRACQGGASEAGGGEAQRHAQGRHAVRVPADRARDAQGAGAPASASGRDHAGQGDRGGCASVTWSAAWACWCAGRAACA